MSDTISTDSMILYIRKIFHDSADLFVEEMEWHDGPAIVCYYSVLTEGGKVNEQIDIIRQRAVDGLSDWGDTAASSVHAFSVPTLNR